jgi:hypothetical protein
MYSDCGESVNSRCMNLRRIRARPSTVSHDSRSTRVLARVQPVLIHVSFPRFTQWISPGRISLLPLTEHYLYPVSTAPINNYNQENSKER